ncbi:dockerin type I repeat protein [Anaerobacterium chartisolvens]|uniref:Dockerin type I repeat protein n=1 Tax=Anaerobacterium chartisolvens TaxID=1297424 RepID=A0A369B2L8_9FIRM|nr:carbohydrate-binding protein [Anaerobacterium chartisolvens]RCX14818.1 dockerin type I repeat protein [Anaerobacterium chartisolvens]
MKMQIKRSLAIIIGLVFILSSLGFEASAASTTISAFTQIEGESYDTQSGIQNGSCSEGGECVGYIENGDYTVYTNLDFESGAKGFKARVASATSGGNIEIRLDSITGSVIGTCAVPGTGDWQNWVDVRCDVSGVSGKHDLYLKYTGGSGYLFNVNWFTFSKGGGSEGILGDLNSDGKIDSVDFLLMKKHILELELLTDSKCADLDGNEAVNTLDLLLMKQFLLGIIDKFPAQKEDPEPTDELNIPWDWAGIIGTGQSLSVGATPLLSTSQRYNNLKLSLGSLTVPPYDANNSSLRMVPLVEPIRSLATSFPGAYPKNIWGETPHTAMANQITAMAKSQGAADYITAHTVVGESGQGYDKIKKGAVDTGNTGRAYAASIFEVTAINRLAKAAGKKYGVGGITLVHGENDNGNMAYENNIRQMWSDYNQDIKAITGQTQKIPMFLVQQHTYPSTGTAFSTTAQWRAGVDYPGDIICIGPNYQRTYGSDRVHLLSSGYQQLGEKFGQVYYERVVLGHDWKPLQPTGATKSGRVITVNFHVPVAPLVWDSTLPAPNQSSQTEWRNGKGFEVTANGSKITISSAEISGSSVKITCASDLPASGVNVGYAFTGGTARSNGSYRWGLLRDSDPFKGSITGASQPNFCVAFQISVQ